MKTKYKDFLNETIRDLMKGKTDEEIKSLVDKLSPKDKLEKSIEHNYIDGINSALKELPKSYNFQHVLDELIYTKNANMLKYILDNAKISKSIIYDSIWKVLNKKSISKDNSYDDIINLLLKKKSDILNSKKIIDPNELLEFGCESNNYDLVKKAIDDGAIIKNKPIPIEVIEYNNLDISKLLLDNGAKYYEGIFGKSPLFVVITTDKLDMLKLFLKYREKINDNSLNNDIIKFIKINIHTEVIKYLLENCSDLIEVIRNKINSLEDEIILYKKYLPINDN